MKSFCCFYLFFFICLNTYAQSAGDDAVLIDLYQNQHFKEAADYLKKEHPEPVTDLKTISRLAYATRMAGKLNEAENYYLRIYAKDSANIPLLISLANLQLKKQNNPKALFYYVKAAQADSTNFAVLKQLGELYLDKPDTAAALKTLLKANKMQPEEADVAVDLALLLARPKTYKQAELVLNKALLPDSANLYLLRTLTKVAYINDDFKTAIKTAETLKFLGDVSAETMNMLATSYYSTKNYLCAIENFGLLPLQSERTHYLTAMSYKALKDYKNAIVFFDATLGDAISPYTNTYYDELGSANEEIKQHRKAITAYQNGLFFKDDPFTYYSLACIFESLHDKNSAVKYFKRYIKSSPPKKEQLYLQYAQSRIIALSK